MRIIREVSPHPFDPLPRRGIADNKGSFAPPLLSPPTEGNVRIISGISLKCAAVVLDCEKAVWKV
jgi:hypothetical protein